LVDINYKAQYYQMIRNVAKIQSQMCDRCPVMKSCCGGCRILKTYINKEKKFANEVKKND